ncbi:MAG: ATP-binding cassette domain-containing protein [Burkholderiaceae bacterium]|nr:ATP-binding cassette domain-containing protein [Burkholderiaceae bacterium]
MPLIAVANGQLAHGHFALLDHVDFSLERGERVALVGRNGSGKSSLLKALAGDTQLDDGEIVRESGATIAYVAQEPVFDATTTVFDAVAGGLGEIVRVIVEYERAAAVVAHGDHGVAALERMAELQHRIDAADAWSLTHRIEGVISRLSLDGEAAIGSLSGGTRKRVALARALVREPDLLLLDEPTNHLDIDSIAWLEELLVAFHGAVLVVTHDRRFLDRVATRVVELDRGRMRSYPGSYADYQRRKASELQAEVLENARFDKLLAAEEVWIRKGVEARRTRDEGRVRRLEALRLERSLRRDRLGSVRLEIDSGERSGKLVAELVEVTKRFGDRVVVRAFSTIIQRGDRVGLIGPNGAGKTTLLKLLLGEIEPDLGEVRLGTGRLVAYFDQLRAQLDDDATVAETISPGSEYVEIGKTRTHVMSYLGRFLFAPERARSPVRSLSGGERNRLLLARLFARPANLLVLDEPTNDLDIDTLELLEELLAEFQGTVLLVSHDRAFLDNVVTQTIASMGDGHWREYAGGYDDYERANARASGDGRVSGESAAPGQRTAARADASPPRPRPAAAKLSYRDQRELEALPRRIADLEREQQAIGTTLADPQAYRGAGVDLESLGARFAQIESELTECLHRWEDLESRDARPG